jgi:hypothetical protein
MFQQADLFEKAPLPSSQLADTLDLQDVIARIGEVSTRPRYAFMVLNLIAKVAGRNSGSAGPYVVERGERVALRDWLCDALVPMANRDARRLAIVAEVQLELTRQERLPEDPSAAERLIQEEVKARVRQSGRCNVSRAVSDLVRAGLVTRHYQGYRVDHHNRGAQREAVYTVTPATASALAGRG